LTACVPEERLKDPHARGYEAEGMQNAG
jgi:hypothetical protein